MIKLTKVLFYLELKLKTCLKGEGVNVDPVCSLERYIRQVSYICPYFICRHPRS